MNIEQKIAKVNEARKAGQTLAQACKRMRLTLSAYHYNSKKLTPSKRPKHEAIDLTQPVSGQQIRVVVMEGDSSSIGDALGKLFSR